MLWKKVYRGTIEILSPVHYKNKIKVVFDELVTSDEIVGPNNAQSYVDGYCSDITSSIHKATEQALMMLPKQKCVRPLRKHWWSQSCKEAKMRHKFWLSLWNDCKRPREGVVYETYKATKNNYRKACRNAFKYSAKMNFKTCSRLLQNKHTKAFWNHIKKAKNRDKNNNYSDISLKDLEEQYSKKFMYDENKESDTVKSARVDVEKKLEALKSVFRAFNITIVNLRDCLKYLKKGRAAGKDGLVTEHLLYGSDSLLYIHLCKLLSICYQYGVVPSIFRQGILVPILKKPTLDPSCAKNFRPVIISTVFSKIVELIILKSVNNLELSDAQFGFISGRGTTEAISLAHDLCAYANHRGSSLFMCGLDAQGAFDCIPNPVLFQKADSVLPDQCWRLLHSWYKDITVQVRWGPLGNPIRVMKGTRQGGLSCTFLFNLVYKDMIRTLQSTVGGFTRDNTAI